MQFDNQTFKFYQYCGLCLEPQKQIKVTTLLCTIFRELNSIIHTVNSGCYMCGKLPQELLLL